MRIDHILLATDLSDASRFAFPHAAGLAQAFGAKLTVLHVDEVAELSVHSSDELSEYLKIEHTIRGEAMNAVAEEIGRFGVEVDMQLRVGPASQQILAFAEENDVDIIVIAKHGARAARHLFMGFTSKRLVRHARVPVLVVPPPQEGEEPGDKPVEYSQVMVSTDFSHDSERGLMATIDLAKALDARVNVVHVLRIPAFVPSLPGEPALVLNQERVSVLKSRYEVELERLTADLGEDRLISTFTIGDDVAETLAETARESGAQLIACPSHGKGAIRAVLFGSTAERLLGVATVPVMVMPKEFLERPWSASVT